MNANADAATPLFEITRSFKAPRQRVWAAWADPAQLGAWWGPTDCAVEVLRLEFKPGGFFHYTMSFPGQPISWGRFNFRELVPNERLVWLNSFANADCGIARAPFSEVCPMEIENSAGFTEQAGVTTITLRATPFGATAQEKAFFAELCSSDSLAQGYGGTLDQLADHLKTAAD